MKTGKIQEDCYWVNEEIQGTDDSKMVAVCVGCARKIKADWFWEGSELGYGDYDLQCYMCGTQIHLR